MRRTFTRVASLGGAVLLLLAAWGNVPAGGAPARPGPIVVEIGDRYGPVAPTEALWSIANRLRPEGAVTVQQMMMALLRANPNAFFHDNVNWLKRGHILRLPAASELRALSAREALLAIKSQNDLWRAADGVLPGVEPERLAAPSADLVDAAPAASPQPAATADAAPEQATTADAGLGPPGQSEGAGGPPRESSQGPAEGAALPRAGGAEPAPAAETQDPPPAAPVKKEDPVPVVASTPAKTAAKDEGQWEIIAWIEEKTAALTPIVSEFAQDWLPDDVWEKWLDWLNGLPSELQENLAASVVLAGLVLLLLLILWWLWPRRSSASRRNSAKRIGPAIGSRRPVAQRAQRKAPPPQSAGAAEADDMARNKLDLAKAYIALGDKEQANAALQEVLTEGNPAQQKEARALLAQLGQ